MKFIIVLLRRFFFQSIISYKALFGWLKIESYMVIKIVVPILQVSFFSLLSKYAFQTDDISPWIIGNSILLCSRNAIYGVGRVIMEDRDMGTLKLIIASPANKFLVFVGRGLMHIVDALITVLIGLFVGFIFFNLHIPLNNLFLFILAIVISIYSAMAIGHMISVVGLAFRDIIILLNVFEYLLIILTGASFPISRLPIFLQGISNFLPITRGIKAARLLLDSANRILVLKLLSREFLIGTIYILFGFFVFSFFESISRKKATLDLC